jgi:hypothetical protein
MALRCASIDRKEWVMSIRTYQPGDEAAQVEIYNTAAAALPKFKLATLVEVRQRMRAQEFDPTARFFAVEGERIVGYAGFHANGRVSFPWCLPGKGRHTEPLFNAMLRAMKARGMAKAFAAYRGDWKPTTDFFLNHGFRQAREMVNFFVELADMPTTSQASSPMTPLRPEDIPAIFELAPNALRARSPEELARHLLHNPYFDSDAVFVLRARTEGKPIVGAGLVVEKPPYADPRHVDPDMPCFRLGAFGTEGMQTKRINGLFSFLVAPGRDVTPLALDMLGHAAYRLDNANVATLAAQVPSDVPHLLRFYQHYFRRQGSFPVFERDLS